MFCNQWEFFVCLEGLCLKHSNVQKRPPNKKPWLCCHHHSEIVAFLNPQETFWRNHITEQTFPNSYLVRANEFLYAKAIGRTYSSSMSFTIFPLATNYPPKFCNYPQVEKHWSRTTIVHILLVVSPWLIKLYISINTMNPIVLYCSCWRKVFQLQVNAVSSTKLLLFCHDWCWQVQPKSKRKFLTSSDLRPGKLLLPVPSSC